MSSQPNPNGIDLRRVFSLGVNATGGACIFLTFIIIVKSPFAFEKIVYLVRGEII